MTLQELSRYYKLHERLEKNLAMLTSLYAAAGLGAQVITGMPHTPGISDRVGSLVVEIEDLKSKIEYLEPKCTQEKKKLEGYINTIKDDQTRMIFRLRFLHCMTWPQVAQAIGGGNTGTNVKLICYRYLKKT